MIISPFFHLGVILKFNVSCIASCVGSGQHGWKIVFKSSDRHESYSYGNLYRRFRVWGRIWQVVTTKPPVSAVSIIFGTFLRTHLIALKFYQKIKYDVLNRNHEKIAHIFGHLIFQKEMFFSTSYYNVIEIVLTYRFWANSSLLWNIPYPDFPIQTPRHKKRVLFWMKGYTFYSFRMNKLEKTIFFCQVPEADTFVHRRR